MTPLVQSVIRPKQPKHEGWQYVCPWRSPDGYEAHAWRHAASDLCVISALEVADDEPEKGPEYHISVTKGGRSRCSRHEAKWVLDQFELDGAEEDNHVPGGIARNFWRPVADRLVGMECKCKDEETAIKEDGGEYIWREANQTH